MSRVLLGIVVVLLIVAGAAVWLNTGASASPQAQQKPEGTPGSAPQKAGGQGAPGAQTKQGPGGAAGTGGRVITAAPATEDRVQLVFTYTGTVAARSQVSIAPKTSGRLERILVDVGSEVKEGDPIANLERGTLQLAVQQAEANLKTVQARLVTVQAGGRAEDIASAEAALASARARLNQVRNGPTASDLQAAQSAVDSARANLASVETRLEAVKAGPTDADIAAAQSTLASAQSASTRAQSDVETARSNLRNTEVRLAQVRAGALAADLQAAQAAVATAKSTLLSAQDRYETAKSDWSKASSQVTSVSQAAQAVDSAQASHDSAVQKLNQLLAGPQLTDLQAAQTANDNARVAVDSASAAVDSSRASLESAQARLTQLKNTPTASDLQAAQSAVDSARATLASADARLAQLSNGPTADDLTIAEATVTQAMQTLALRQQPYTSQDLLTAQAAVENSRAALAVAQGNLADATLVAPFSGIITARLVSPGAMVSTQTGVATLIGSDLEITVPVEESRIGRLKPGLAVAVAASAYPGEAFTGKVTGIAPTADTRSHTFAMKVVPENPGGKLKPGMFAEMKVTADEHTGTLVPRDAVVQRSGKDVVFVIADGRAQMREVVSGLPQGARVEILSGVKAGEQVIVVGHGGLNHDDPVRTVGAAGGQPSEQPQQPRPGAPGKTQ